MNKQENKVLMVQDAYAPYLDASTICVSYIRKELNRRGIPVDTYILLNHTDGVEEDGINKVFIMPRKHDKWITKYRKRAERKRSFLRKVIDKLFFTAFISRTDHLHADLVDIGKLLQQVRRNNEKQKYTHVFDMSSEIGITRIAFFIKKKLPQMKWTSYSLDPYEYNYMLPKDKIEKRKRLFAKYTRGLDKLILTRGIDVENCRQGYDNGCKEITLEVELPNLVVPINSNRKPKNINTDINLIYAGSFYEDIRNPSKMLEIFSQILNKRIVFNVFGRASNYLSENYQELDDKIVLNGNKNPIEMESILSQADILISLGNTTPNQVPSKVFEYIATGKPIVNFFFNEDDTSLYYLKRYPLAFNINVNSYTDEDIKNLEKFIEANKDKVMAFEEATKDLQDCLSEKVCAKIVDAMLNC